MGTQHLVLRSDPLDGVSGEVAREGVSGHLRLGQGCPAASLASGLDTWGWKGILYPRGEKRAVAGPVALGTGDVKAALGARLCAGSSSPFLPTSCPQGLKATATHPRGSGGGGTTGSLPGYCGLSLLQVPKVGGSPWQPCREGEREEVAVLGGHLPRQEGHGGSWGPGVLGGSCPGLGHTKGRWWLSQRKACGWEQSQAAV